MAGVEADADARVPAEAAQQIGQLLEAVAQRRALAGRVLEQHHRPAAAPGPQQARDRRRDGGQARFLRARRVGTGVEDDAEQAERLRPVDFFAERGNGAGAQPRFVVARLIR